MALIDAHEYGNGTSIDVRQSRRAVRWRGIVVVSRGLRAGAARGQGYAILPHRCTARPRTDVLVDCSVEHQEYIEDCSVCCRPIVITAVTFDGEVVSIDGRSEDE